MSFKLMLDLEFYNKKKKQSINLSHLYYEAAARPDTGLRAPLVLLEGKLFYSDFFLRVGRRILPIPERSLGRLWKLKRKL